MLDLPPEILSTLSIFSPLFSRPVYRNALFLFLGFVLSKGRRTVADVLRNLHFSNIKNYSKFHWILSKAKWSALKGSKLLFVHLLMAFSIKEITIALDSTVERRKGPKIQGLGRQRDAARSSKNNKVLCIGIQWLVSAIILQFPFTTTPWALPFLSILMPPKLPLRSSKNSKDLNKKTKHKKMTSWAHQVVCLLRRWSGKNRKITVVADSAFACFKMLYVCKKHLVTLISRLRLDARLYEFVPEKISEKRGRKRVVGKVLPKLSVLAKDEANLWNKMTARWYGGTTKEIYYKSGKSLWYYIGFPPVEIHWVLITDPSMQSPVALFSTDLNQTPQEIVETFVKRWALEVTFEETRRHLGMETQRQWSDKAIARTTPVVLAAFSIVTVMGLKLAESRAEKIQPQKTSWYKKEHITFSDVHAYVKMPLLRWRLISLVGQKTELKKKDWEEFLQHLVAA